MYIFYSFVYAFRVLDFPQVCDNWGQVGQISDGKDGSRMFNMIIDLERQIKLKYIVHNTIK
jgi:hypothetical protein